MFALGSRYVRLAWKRRIGKTGGEEGSRWRFLVVNFSVCRVSIPLIQSSRERLPGRYKRYLREVTVNIPVSKLMVEARRGFLWLLVLVARRSFPDSSLSRVLSRLADSSPTGNGGGSGCKRTHNSHEIHPVYIQKADLSPLHARMQRASRNVLHCEEKNEVSSANCGGTLGSRKIVGYFRGDTRMAEISLGYEWWACVWDCVSWTRMRRVHYRYSFVSELMRDLYGRVSLEGNYIDAIIIIIIGTWRAFNAETVDKRSNGRGIEICDKKYIFFEDWQRVDINCSMFLNHSSRKFIGASTLQGSRWKWNEEEVSYRRIVERWYGRHVAERRLSAIGREFVVDRSCDREKSR